MTSSAHLPSGWVLAPFGTLGEWAGGGTPSKSESSFWSDGSIPWVSPKDMKVFVISDSIDHITEAAIEESSAKLIAPGSVLFVMRSGILAHTFPVARTVVPVAVNQDLKALTPSAPLAPDYIAWGARAFGSVILEECSKDGTTVASVDTGLLHGFQLPIAPQGEQRRIVEAIESYFTRLDAAVANLGRVQQNLGRYRASVLKAAVEGRLVPTEAELARAEGRDYEPASVLLERILVERRRRWEEAERAKMKAKGETPKSDKWKAEYKQPLSPDMSDLPALPTGWCWSSLGELFDIRVGSTPSRSKPEYWNGGIPWVSSGEVAFCRIASTKETISEAGLNNSSANLNPAGSVLLGMIGEGKTRGQTAILNMAACNNQNSAAIWVGEFGLPSEYVYFFLMEQYEETRTRGSGNNQPALNKSRVQAIPIPIPPVEEARRIAAAVSQHLSVVDSLEADASRGLVRCGRLRQSILKWAFEGKLADQDPSDERAAALLERIKSEREIAADKKPKARRRRKSGSTKP